MDIKIYREGGSLRLDETELAKRLRTEGFVVFESTRTRQREIAFNVRRMLKAEGLSVLEGETDSPNGCMCLIDTERYSLLEFLKIAATQDREDEARESNP